MMMSLSAVFILLYTGLGAASGTDLDMSSSDADDTEIPYTSPRTGYACEGSTLTIRCPPFMKISVIRVNYGRLSMAVCNEGRTTSDTWDLQCMSTRALRIVSDMCEGKPWCRVSASNSLLGDTCSSTPKYLEIEYQCEGIGEGRVSNSSGAAADEGQEVDDHAETTSSSRSSTTGRSSSSSSKNKNTGSSVEEAGGGKVSPAPPLPLLSGGSGWCEGRTVRNVAWPRTRSGQNISVECPNNRKARKAMWECGSIDWIGRPDLTRCVSTSVVNIENSLQYSGEHFTAGMVEKIADDLVTLTEPTEVIFGGDLTHITDAMTEAVDQIDVHVHEVSAEVAPNLLRKVNNAVLMTSSNLLDEKHVESWMDLPQSTQAETASKIINSLEESAFQVARQIQQPTIIVNITLNIVLEIRVVDVRSDAVVPDRVMFSPKFDSSMLQSDSTSSSSWNRPYKTWNDCGDSIVLTGNTIRQLSNDGTGLARIVFTTYENLDHWMQPPRHGNNYYDDNYIHGSQPYVATDIRLRHGDPVSRHGDPVSRHDYYEEQGRRELETVLPPAYDVDNKEDKDEWTSKDKKNKNEEEEKEDDKIVATRIISASVNNRSVPNTEPLEEPITYTLEHRTPEQEIYNPSCSFWEYSEKTMQGKWSTFGCDLVDTNQTHTTCSCRHLTNFAVLMSVRTHKRSAGHDFALALITYFGSIASIICLIAAFLTFACLKNLQCDRNTIHKNLVLTLCIAELLFLCGIMQTGNKIVCSVIAGVLHYLFLVAFAWMSLEGIQLYVMLVEVFEAERSRVKWYYASAYGLPALAIAISVGVDRTGYGTKSHCWLNSDTGFIWAFVGPVCGIICVNIVMLSVAIFVMCRHANNAANQWKMKEKGKVENIRSWIKGAMVLVVLLGLTWAFGLFYVNEETAVFAYLFTLLNCTQGIFIFVFHCLMNDKVQKEYKKLVRRATWLPENIRVKYGGAKASASTTRVNSTSSGVNYLTRLLSNRRRKRSSDTSLPTSTAIPRGNGYNKMCSPARNSSSVSGGTIRDSARTDSGIVGCMDSHIYSEPTDDDPCAYLEPVRIRLDPDEEMYIGGGDMSVMEGSVADTDYMDNFTQRGVLATTTPRTLNIDKYKILPPERYTNCLSTISQDQPISESEYSDGELFNMTTSDNKLHPSYCNHKLSSYSHDEPDYSSDKLNSCSCNEQDLQNTFDSLFHQKLLAKSREEKSCLPLDNTSVNNLNKPAARDTRGVEGGGGGYVLSSDSSACLPNIVGTPSPEDRSLLYNDNNCCVNSSTPPPYQRE